MGDNNTSNISPVIEFGLNKCTQNELNSYNLLYLLIWYPFSSFVLRFQLNLFIILNWLKSSNKKNNKNHKKYSNKPYHPMHKKRLSYFELFNELFKIMIGGFCFMFKTIWNIIDQ